jgi:hypothetical protein
MTHDEMRARRELAELAEDDQGRALLQLALRGIQTSGNGLTIGCWVKPGGGVSGCVFQHAYWQGVSEGTFQVDQAANREIRDHVSERDFRLVMEAIRALDRLGKRQFMRWQGLHHELDEAAWRNAVERLLIDALAQRPAGTGQMPVPSSARQH